MTTRYITLRNGDPYRYGDMHNCMDEYVVGAHLGKVSRYSGATRTFYSVAQHSCFVADVIRDVGQPVLTQLKGLLHDAHESFCSDMPTPFQDWVTDLIEARFGERYDVIEHAKTIMDQGVYAAFGLAPPTEEERYWIKYADTLALITEGYQLLDPIPDWIKAYKLKPADFVLIPLQPEYATSAFVAKYRQLRGALPKAA